MSGVCQCFFKAFGKNLVTVNPTNHKSLLAEHGIKSSSNIMVKHGKIWDIFPDTTMPTYKTYGTPNLHNFSPLK